MKGLSVRLGSFALLFVAAASIAGTEHCSSPTNSGSPFVGTWSCPASLAALGETLVITENLDDSLTLAAGGDGGGGNFCPSDLWTYSGATATMRAGTSCPASAAGASDDAGAGQATAAGDVLTVNSFSMTVSGDTLTVNANETLLTGDSNNKTVKSVLALSGSCSKH